MRTSFSATLLWLAKILGLLSLLSIGGISQVQPASVAFQQVIEELDFKNADLRDVVRILAKKYRINVYVDNKINKKVTLHLVNVSLEDALTFIVESSDVQLRKVGSIYKITGPPDIGPPPKAWNIQYTNDLLSLDFRDEDIREALYQVSQKTGITILPDRGVKGKISGMIKLLPFAEGLGRLLKSNGYFLKKEEDSYTVRRSGFAADPQNPSSGGMWVNVNNGLIDLEIANADLKSVLDEISRQVGVNFFLLGDPKGKVNTRATGLSLDETLTFVLLESDFTFKKSKSVYLIGKIDNKAMVTSRLLKLKYMKVDGILEMLPKKVLGKAEIKVIKEHNALLVNGAQNVIAEIEAVVKDIDHPIPQIFFEMLVVDFTTSNTKDFSIQAGVNAPRDSARGTFDGWIPGVDLLLNGANVNDYLERLSRRFTGVNIGRLPTNFFLKIKALEAVGKANIRSRPQISTLNGHTAELKIGETRYFKLVSETPYADPNQVYRQTSERFRTVEINISLKITPWVSASGEITVEIQPVFNTPGDQAAPDIPPNIQSRALNSTVRLRDGETIVLGGLIQEVENASISRVPILGRIPLLGALFTSKSSTKIKNELIIYVTPHLSYSDDWLTPPKK